MDGSWGRLVVGITVTATVLGLLLPGTGVRAHAGNDCGFEDGPERIRRLEAECYTEAEPRCDPNLDAEHTRVDNASQASAGQDAFLPGSGCEVRFPQLRVPGNGTFVRFTARPQNCGSVDGQTIEGRISVNGSTVAAGEAELACANSTWQRFPFANRTLVEEGVRNLTLGYQVTNGSSWINARIDVVAFACDGCEEPDGSPDEREGPRDVLGIPLGPVASLALAAAAVLAGRRVRRKRR